MELVRQLRRSGVLTVSQKIVVFALAALLAAAGDARLAGAIAQGVPSAQCQNPGIVMIATSWCGYCRRARNFFRENNIDFDEIDAEQTQNESIRQTFKRNGVPFIVVGGEEVRGFDERRLRKLLCLPG